MASTLLRTGLRYVISNGVFEKRTISVLCNGIMTGEHNIKLPQQKLQVNIDIYVINNEQLLQQNLKNYV